MTSATTWAQTVLDEDRLPIILVRPQGLVLIPIHLSGPMYTAAKASPMFRSYVAACAVWQFGEQVEDLT